MSTMTSERELLSSYLDDGGWHTEAENVRNGVDLDSYEIELRLIDWLHRHTHLAQPVQAVDVGVIRALVQAWRTRIPANAGDSARVLMRESCADQLEAALTRAISGEKAGPVGKYRLLGPNDAIEPDDEFIDDNAVDWVRAGSASGGHLFIGMQYRLGVLKQARRPLPASPAPDKEG